MILFAEWFRSYGILKTDLAAEFCFLDRTTAEQNSTFGLYIS
jgi:hypothetical protein